MEKIIDYLYSIERVDDKLHYKFTFYSRWIIDSFNNVDFVLELNSNDLSLYRFYCSDTLTDIQQHEKIVDFIGKIIDLNEEIDNKNREIEEQINKYKEDIEKHKNNLLTKFKKTNSNTEPYTETITEEITENKDGKPTGKKKDTVSGQSPKGA